MSIIANGHISRRTYTLMTKYKISNNGVGSIPKGETSIDDHSFKMCKKLTSIVIPEGVVDIGSEAFYDCTYIEKSFLDARLFLTFALVDEPYSFAINIGESKIVWSVYE